MLQVKDKVAFITGALGGLGQAYTIALLRNGLKGVSLIDVSDENAESFQNELSNEFGANKTIFIKTDVRERKQIKDAFEKTVAHFKQLDIVINNAGTMKEEDIEGTVTLNIIAPLIITEMALKTYLPKYQKNSGLIINTSSTAGLMAVNHCPIYCVTKHGLVSMSAAFGSQENYEKYKVKVLTICPGPTVTPLTIRLEQENRKLSVPLDKQQSASCVGECLLKAIKSDKNGSVWVVHCSNIKEFDYSQFGSMGRKFIEELSTYN